MLNVRLFDFLGSYKLFLTLFIALLLMLLGKTLYLNPALSESQEAKTQIAIERLNAHNRLSPAKIVDFLESLTRIHNPQLWIHKIELSNGKIKMFVRGLNSGIVNNYLYAVEKANKLVIDSLIVKNKDYAMVDSSSQEDTGAPIPFALKMFFDRQKRTEAFKQGNSKEANIYDNILYYYEAEVVLANPKTH
jgi:hypothetical protein